MRLGFDQSCVPAGLLRDNRVQALEEVDDLAQQHGGRQRARPEGVEQEQQERLVVAEPHGVGDPHACAQAAGLYTLSHTPLLDHGRKTQAEGAVGS